jgi:adenylate cyclase
VHEHLRAQLRELGATDEEIERAEAQGWLPLLAVDRVLLPGQPRYDLEAAAEKAGVDTEFTRRLWRAMGFADSPRGVAAFTDRDVEAVRLAAARLRPGDDVHLFLRQSRAIGAVMARLGAIDADLIARALDDMRAEGLDDETIAETVMLGIDWPSLAFLIDHVHRVQARAAVWRRLARDAYADVGLGIGFCDLAGYTELSAELDPDQLSDLLTTWEDVSYDLVAELGGRVVKSIGDEVMFVGIAADVARIAVALCRAIQRDVELPPARAGVASGPVIARDGDYYGPVVNLASRLTDLAEPGQVLASSAMREQLAEDDSLVWTSLGVHAVRSIGDVEVFALGNVDRDDSVA